MEADFFFSLDYHTNNFTNKMVVVFPEVYICLIPLDMFQLFISFVLCVIESSKSESFSAKQT